MKHLLLTAAFASCVFVMNTQTAHSAPQSPKEHFIARCTLMSNSQDLGPLYFDVIGLGATKQCVKVFGQGHEATIPSSNRMINWIEYHVEFVFKGENAQLDLSNYISPSLANLRLGSETFPVACALKKSLANDAGNTQDTCDPEPQPQPEPPPAPHPPSGKHDSCFEECGRSCKEQPVFCGGW